MNTAEASGLHFKSTPVQANSHKALEAAEFARDMGPDVFDRFHKRLFRAYFEEQENIGLVDVLCRLAAECDMDAELLQGALERQQFAARVDRGVRWAHEIGISSTPTFIFANQYAIVGAQEYPAFQQMMETLGVMRKA